MAKIGKKRVGSKSTTSKAKAKKAKAKVKLNVQDALAAGGPAPPAQPQPVYGTCTIYPVGQPITQPGLTEKQCDDWAGSAKHTWVANK